MTDEGYFGLSWEPTGRRQLQGNVRYFHILSRFVHGGKVSVASFRLNE